MIFRSAGNSECVVASFLAAAAIAAYLLSMRQYRARFPARPFPGLRIASFCAGAMLFAVCLLPAADALADRSFAWHMLQHMIIVFVAAPLVLLGAPVLLIVSVPPARLARCFTRFSASAPGRALFAPALGWVLFVFVLWGAHFSPLYESAMEHPAVHLFEHVLFTGSALLFWNSVIQIGYAPRPVPYPLRMLYLFLAIPQGAFVAFAIGASSHPLYPHYNRLLGVAGALADQRNGADVMWIVGGFLMFAAFMAQGATWAVAERGARPA
ncbi:MAG: cytochrome c oxidase assembly protein [Candidatus Baltobacteraceae bacterium]